MFSVFLFYLNFTYMFLNISMWLKTINQPTKNNFIILPVLLLTVFLALYSLKHLKWFHFLYLFLFMTQHQYEILGILLGCLILSTSHLLCQVNFIITKPFRWNFFFPLSWPIFWHTSFLKRCSYLLICSPSFDSSA